MGFFFPPILITCRHENERFNKISLKTCDEKTALFMFFFCFIRKKWPNTVLFAKSDEYSHACAACLCNYLTSSVEYDKHKAFKKMVTYSHMPGPVVHGVSLGCGLLACRVG